MDRSTRFRREIRALLARVSAAALLVAFAPAAPGLAATFAPQQQIGTSFGDPYRSLAGRLFEDGSAAVGWGYDAPQLALRAPGQPIGPARALARTLHRIAPDPRGGGLYAFDVAERRAAVVGIAGGTLGTPADLGRGRPGEPVADARGDVIVPVHTGARSRVRLMLRPHGAASFRTALAIEEFHDYALVPLRDGFAVAWWSWEDCARPSLTVGCIQVRAAVARDGRAFGPVRKIGPSGGVRQRSSEIELRLLPLSGTGALVAWNGRGRTAQVRAATLASRGSHFGQAAVISRPERRARQVEAVANGRGDALVAWIERRPRGSGELRLATLGRDRRFHGSRRMSDAGTDARSPRLRLNQRGDALLTWSSGPRWWVRTRTRTSSFTLAHAMPASPRPWHAQLALDRAGTVLALFRRAHDSGGGEETATIESGAWPVGSTPRTRILDAAAGWNQPTMATNDGGTAFAVWSRDAGLAATVRQPGRDFDAPVAVGSQIVGEPRPHINGRGDLLIVSYGWRGSGEPGGYEIGAVLGAATP